MNLQRPSLARRADFELAMRVAKHAEALGLLPLYVREAEGPHAKGRWKACVVVYTEPYAKRPGYMWTHVRICVERGKINVLAFGPEYGLRWDGCVTARPDITDPEDAAWQLLGAHEHRTPSDQEVQQKHGYNAIQEQAKLVERLRREGRSLVAKEADAV